MQPTSEELIQRQAASFLETNKQDGSYGRSVIRHLSKFTNSPPSLKMRIVNQTQRQSTEDFDD